MPRWKGIVKQIREQTVIIGFEDGQEAVFPRAKMSKGISEGTIIYVSVSVDRIAALLKQATLASDNIKFSASSRHGG